MAEGSNNSGKIAGMIAVAVLVLAGGAGAWYWFMYKPKQEAKEQARLEQIAAEEAERERQEREAQKKIKFEELIVLADTAFNQENWESARALYAEASGLYPKQQYPKGQLALVNAKLDEIAALEARKAAGIVETVSDRTGRYYVIVSSSIDDDLAMDYAKKLANEGNSIKIIEHNANDLPFYGVAVADFDTWEDAESSTTSFSHFSGEAWVLKF